MYTTIVNAGNLKKGDIIVCKRNVKVNSVYKNKAVDVKNKNKHVSICVPHRGLIKVLNYKTNDKVKIIRPSYNKEK